MPQLRCPLCREVLFISTRAAVCAQGHGFDRAREGYFNLLPAQHKNSLKPGDDSAMVSARQRFLEAGYYTPLLTALCAAVLALHPEQLLDSGCGEGWYTARLSAVAAQVVGVDISKAAIKRAAKRTASVTWLVASSAKLPMMDRSVDAITAIFSPLPMAEAARVLRPGGSVFVIAPDAAHLRQLRAALFAAVRPHVPEKWSMQLAPAFSLLTELTVQFPLELPDGAAVQALLGMTPYIWRAPVARRDIVASLPALTTQAAFRIMQFVRND